MWIKRQEGYCLKEIAGVHYLLPYGQKVADQRKGIVLNETGVFLWNELQTSMTDDALAEKLVHHYSADGEAANETQDEIQDQTNPTGCKAVCSRIIVIGDFAGMFASLLCRGRG